MWARATLNEVSIHAPAWGATWSSSSAPARRAGFNPRARVGRDVPVARRRCRPVSFNPRARVGRDSCRHPSRRTRYGFNPRARVGRDLLHLRAYLAVDRVSIHAPAWGATSSTPTCASRSGCFNPRARVGRDVNTGGLLPQETSFNPRARVGRDSTKSISRWSTRTSFNPRARVGRDRDPRQVLRDGSRFNPRARVGRDHADHHRPPAQQVSIHAPAWGATCACAISVDRSAFQSTRPRGARPRSIGEGRGVVSGFNPRARVGRDVLVCPALEGVDNVSIHAPAWGATQDSPSGLGRGVVSIHAPAWGATGDYYNVAVTFQVSIHAPAWGATPPY